MFVFELLHIDTQEERYMGSLAARQALVDFVFDNENGDDSTRSRGSEPTQLIQRLDTNQLLRLIQP